MWRSRPGSVIGLEGKGKIRYCSTGYWLQQNFDAQAASVFSAVLYILCVPIALLHAVHNTLH